MLLSLVRRALPCIGISLFLFIGAAMLRAAMAAAPLEQIVLVLRSDASLPRLQMILNDRAGGYWLLRQVLMDTGVVSDRKVAIALKTPENARVALLRAVELARSDLTLRPYVEEILGTDLHFDDVVASLHAQAKLAGVLPEDLVRVTTPFGESTAKWSLDSSPLGILARGYPSTYAWTRAIDLDFSPFETTISRLGWLVSRLGWRRFLVPQDEIDALTRALEGALNIGDGTGLKLFYSDSAQGSGWFGDSLIASVERDIRPRYREQWAGSIFVIGRDGKAVRVLNPAFIGTYVDSAGSMRVLTLETQGTKLSYRGEVYPETIHVFVDTQELKVTSYEPFFTHWRNRTTVRIRLTAVDDDGNEFEVSGSLDPGSGGLKVGDQAVSRLNSSNVR